MPVTAVRDEGALRMWVCRLPVYIDPAGCTGFTEIFGEFVTSHWADRVVGPYRVSANPYYPANFDRKAFLPQILNRNCSQICCTGTGGAQYSARRVSLCVRNN